TKMRDIAVLLLLLVSLATRGVQSASNVTVYMEDYIRQNQLQYDAKLKEYESQLANFRETYARELRAIDVQADQLQVKLEEAAGRLRPIELIDSWHKQCVQNYSANIPLIVTVRNAMTACSTTAQNNLNSILVNCQNTYTNLKSYYNNNLKTMLSNCEKQNPISQLNYTICVTNVIAAANKETVTSQKNFNTYMQQATCSAEARITQAWECAFATVYSTSATLGTALQLVDDCIANKLACASVSCTTGCNNQMVITLSDADFSNATIKNPFFGLNSKLGCLLMRF
ncbi:hypothetical protein KR222_002308, partial [Zaprionus bogoriensis]